MLNTDAHSQTHIDLQLWLRGKIPTSAGLREQANPQRGHLQDFRDVSFTPQTTVWQVTSKAPPTGLLDSIIGQVNLILQGLAFQVDAYPHRS
jgi:hypothetical protein